MPVRSHKRKSIKRKSIKRKSIKRKSIKRKSTKRKSIKRRIRRGDGSKSCCKRKHELISSSETPEDPLMKKRIIEKKKYDEKDLESEYSDEFNEMDKFVDSIRKGLIDAPSVYICPGAKKNLEESITKKMIVGRRPDEKGYCWAYNANTYDAKEKWDSLKIGSLCIFGEVVGNDVDLFKKAAFVTEKVNFQNIEDWPFRELKDWKYGFLLSDPFAIRITKRWMVEQNIKSSDTLPKYKRTQQKADEESARKIKEKIRLQY